MAGSRNTLALDSEGQVLSWGWNARGTLGHGDRCAALPPSRPLPLPDFYPIPLPAVLHIHQQRMVVLARTPIPLYCCDIVFGCFCLC